MLFAGANIFLTSKGRLKLGDFGCSVKLKNHTTMAGEVNSLVGTTGKSQISCIVKWLPHLIGKEKN